jgi:hypothetical protein
MEASSPSPTTEAGRNGEEQPPCPPPAEKSPSCRGLQIEAARERIKRGPAKPAATASSGGDSLISSPGTPTAPRVILRAWPSSSPCRRPPRTPEREGNSPATCAAIGAGVQLERGKPPKQGNKTTLGAVQGGPADPLPISPAGGAAGGGGEGGRQADATAGLSHEGEGRERSISLKSGTCEKKRLTPSIWVFKYP